MPGCDGNSKVVRIEDHIDDPTRRMTHFLRGKASGNQGSRPQLFRLLLHGKGVLQVQQRPLFGLRKFACRSSISDEHVATASRTRWHVFYDSPEGRNSSDQWLHFNNHMRAGTWEEA